MALRAAYLRMHRGGDAHFGNGGVTTDQFLVLFSLADRGPQTQQELARSITSDPNTLRAMVLLLERHGLVRRAPHPTDGRARVVSLTDDGARLADTLWSESDGFRQRLVDVLGVDDAAALTRLLVRLAVGLAAIDPATPDTLPSPLEEPT